MRNALHELKVIFINAITISKCFLLFLFIRLNINAIIFLFVLFFVKSSLK